MCLICLHLRFGANKMFVFFNLMVVFVVLGGQLDLVNTSVESEGEGVKIKRLLIIIIDKIK